MRFLFSRRLQPRGRAEYFDAYANRSASDSVRHARSPASPRPSGRTCSRRRPPSSPSTAATGRRCIAPAPCAVALPAHDRRGLAPARAVRRSTACRSCRRAAAPASPAARSPRTASSCSRSRACAAWIRSTCSARTVRVQAGAVTEAVHQHCAPHGLTWPVDFASKGSSQVGGNIATNAGGVKVIRYGLTRQWVLGLAGGARAAARCSSSTARSRRTTPASICGSSSSAARARSASSPRRRSSSRACPRSSTCCSSRVADLAGGARAVPRGAAAAPFTLAAYEFFTERCLARVPRHRKRAPAVRRAVRRTTCSLEVERRRRRRRRSRAWRGVGVFERGLVDRRHARAARGAGGASCGRCARASARASRPPGCRTRTTSRCRSPRSRRSAPSSTRSSRSATRAGRSASSATSATATCTST